MSVQVPIRAWTLLSRLMTECAPVFGAHRRHQRGCPRPCRSGTLLPELAVGGRVCLALRQTPKTPPWVRDIRPKVVGLSKTLLTPA